MSTSFLAHATRTMRLIWSQMIAHSWKWQPTSGHDGNLFDIIGMEQYLIAVSPLGVEREADKRLRLEIRMTPDEVPPPAEFLYALRTGCSRGLNSCPTNIS